MKLRGSAAACAALVAAAISFSRDARAFWLLNFQTAATLPPGGAGFIGGTGGQFTSVGSPPRASFTPFLAHAGIRVGLIDRLDAGYRLCTVALPYSSAGPTLGEETDLKFQLTPSNASWQVGIIGGVGYAYLLLSGQSRDAWAPGANLIVSRAVSSRIDLSWNFRYVDTFISSGPGGPGANQVQAYGGGMGIKVALGPTLAVLPEVGAFDFRGRLSGVPVDGYGFQYGVVLSARIN